MEHHIKSIRPFIGSKDFDESRAFYTAFGFSEMRLSDILSYFHLEGFGFYLQDYYLKDWVDNSMLFIEVADVDTHFAGLQELQLKDHFPNIIIKEIQRFHWGDEYFVHDPSGVLLHIGTFK